MTSPSQPFASSTASGDLSSARGAASTRPGDAPLALQVQQILSQFRAVQPSASLTVSLAATLPQGSGTEYIVLATLSVNGQVLGSSLAAGASVAVAQSQAQWQALVLSGLTEGAIAAQASPGIASQAAVGIAPPAEVESSQVQSSQAQSNATAPAPTSDLAAASASPAPTPQNDGLDDGLGDTAIGFGETLAGPQEGLEEGPEDELEQDSTTPASPAKAAKPKPKSKTKAKTKTADSPPATEPQAFPPASTEASPGASPLENSPEDAAPEFVDDWSEDLAQIAVELKRLGWTDPQEREYLQRTYSKASRDDITDHNELLDYLIYLQALPSQFDASADPEAGAIAEASLSVDEADLAPQSLSELMASTGLRPASALASEPQASEAASPPPSSVGESSAEDPSSTLEQLTPEPAAPEPATSEAAPEIAPPAPDLAAVVPSLSRKAMMDETARLCKQLGWKNRQGSEFLQGQYGKATRMDLSDAELGDFLEQLRSLSTEESLPY